MYYVLFSYKVSKQGEKSWRELRNEPEVIEFLHKHFEQIDVHEIIEVRAKHHLGLVVTKDYVRSELEPAEEAGSLIELGKKPEEIIRENKKTLEELEDGETSAMEKIGDDIEEEMEEDMTPEQKAKKAMDDADELIEREKKRKEQKKKGWELCVECNSNRVAPWNKKKICSTCQNERKTTRPYTRSKEFSGL